MKNNRAKGNVGERLAERYLVSKGYEVIDRNVHMGKFAELDLVVLKDGVIHIVEVKSKVVRGIDILGIEFPVYNITARKLAHLRNGTRMYLQMKGWLDKEVCLDAIGVLISDSGKKSWIKMFSNILEGTD